MCCLLSGWGVSPFLSCCICDLKSFIYTSLRFFSEANSFEAFYFVRVSIFYLFRGFCIYVFVCRRMCGWCSSLLSDPRHHSMCLQPEPDTTCFCKFKDAPTQLEKHFSRLFTSRETRTICYLFQLTEEELYYVWLQRNSTSLCPFLSL